MTDGGQAPRRGVRPDGAEVGAQILDLTAGLLARHGVRATSMQMVADASGYSKAAMFRRFGDKERLVEAALRRCVDLGDEALAAVGDVPPGPDRGRAALGVMLDLALRWPGFIAVALASVTVREGEEFGGRLDALGDALLAMFDLPAVDALEAPEPLLRALGALGVVAVLGLAYRDHTDETTARAVILRTAEAALHGRPPA